MFQILEKQTNIFYLKIGNNRNIEIALTIGYKCFQNMAEQTNVY